MTEASFDSQRPVCRRGVVARDLVNGMVYIRHPKFSSRIINRQTWGFLQLCDGRDFDQLSGAVNKMLGFALTMDQLNTTISEFAARGIFEGTQDNSRNYRICDASSVVSKLSALVRWVATRWFAGVTLFALLTCLTLIVVDWGRFTSSVASAARDHPIATLLLYYITFIPIALLHELGHASVANFHGGEVPEIVICSNGNFAVTTNMTVLKERHTRIWYFSMGTVVDIFVWLALLIAFHYRSSYLLLMFLLPQTIYFLIHSYSIFKNSDYLKVVCEILAQPVPAKPWQFLRKSWADLPENPAARKLLLVMSISLAIKIAVTAFLVWTFAKVEPRVLLLYLIYRLLVYVVGHWANWWRRLTSSLVRVPRLELGQQ
jgi:hypothetical protein